MSNIWCQVKEYISRVAIAFSILLNTIFGGRSNQTLSATQYERRKQGLWNLCDTIDKIFYWESEHCKNAWIKWKIIHSAIKHYDQIGEFLGFDEKKFK